ncbi:MAG: HPF/RaiA family ribosome-associated protein [Rhodospirillales bacterium]|nr:HPF/RaiA family ribosome-associated protein [Rhodospirillales bacterium]HJO73132.1 HPF/RaiA family ribosome-associated protein [Rhodospirillales bacterium]
MQVPLRISFHGVDASEAVEARIGKLVDNLELSYDRITSCHVAVEAPHKHKTKGRIYNVRIHLVLPNHDLMVGREPGRRQAHEDVYVAISDSFRTARRRLRDYARRQRRE